MDEIDWEIMKQLQEDGRMSMTRLGKEVNLSVPAVKERVQKLEDKQVISGYRAMIDPKKVGKHVMAFVLMETSRCEAFRNFCIGHESVIECHRLAGQYSYLVKVVVE
ncbi:DNA-binding transcriptional regulator, Lrp family [Shouchella lonarensis]|uniref:DNA-binding transcriptional regulator, Lrp family n=1 Tax=Shouchella lonarensis TaxID=1464122 RepID=A0A1G6NEP2_9BACI|nr:DNA-binding transcriptional regulator, Lrp family [Shouchella lonarensis]